jgi:hypothetical protein
MPQKDMFFIETQKGLMKIPPMSRKRVYEHCLNVALQQPDVEYLLLETGQAHMDIFVPVPNRHKDGGIAWRFLHNTIVTPRRLYQWKKVRKKTVHGATVSVEQWSTCF